MGMTPEIAKQHARKFLFESVKRVKFPPNIYKWFYKGEPCLTMEVATGFGEAEITFYPQTSAEYLAVESLGLSDAQAEFLPEEYVIESQRENIESLIAHLLVTCIDEFTETVENIPKLALALNGCLTSECVLQLMSLRGAKNPDGFNSYVLVNKTLEIVNRGRRERMEKAVKDTAAYYRPQFQHLFPVYHYLKPIWDEAKDCYKRNRESARWREIVKAACNDEELELPPDLINRLDGKGANSDSYSSMPSELALEHAARLCGARANQYKPRTLQDHLKESREEFFRATGVEKPDSSDCARLTRKLINERTPRERQLSVRSKLARKHRRGRPHLTAVK